MEVNYFFPVHTHIWQEPGAVPLFDVYSGSDDDKAKHNDPKMDERQTFKLLTALARRRLYTGPDREFAPRKGLTASWSCMASWLTCIERLVILNISMV